MKSQKYARRSYRDWGHSREFHETHVLTRETDVEIFTSKRLDKKFAEERLRALRYDIENYIDRDRRFLASLKPVPVEAGAPEIIKDMAEQTRKANVGPMASVAGAIVQFFGKELVKKGIKDVIVENGGATYIKISTPQKLGVYIGRSKVWNKLRLIIKPKSTPMGFCMSSGTLSHSKAFGSADSIVIISKSVSLADAVATATSNKVNSKDDMQGALDFARGVKGVTGVIIIFKNNILTWGDVELA